MRVVGLLIEKPCPYRGKKLEHRSGCVVCGAHIPTISREHPDEGWYRETQNLRRTHIFDDGISLVVKKEDLA